MYQVHALCYYKHDLRLLAKIQFALKISVLIFNIKLM
jgi:hypothetical protein